jgi:hypothetical protein
MAKSTESKGKQYTPAQQKVVARIVELRKSGKGYPAIAAELNKAKTPTFGKGAQWYGPVVRHICIRELGSAEKSLKAAGTKAPQRNTDTVAQAAAHVKPTPVEAVPVKATVKPDPKVKGSTSRKSATKK